MKPVSFAVYFYDSDGALVNPPAHKRPKVSIRNGRGAALKAPLFRPAPGEIEARYTINAAAVEAGLRVLDDTPGVVVTVLAVKQRTKTKPKSVALGTWKAGGRLPAPVTPDADNHVKLVMDAIGAKGLKGDRSVALWRDDGLVVCEQGWTVYGASGETPHMEISVREVSMTDWPFLVEV